MTPCTPPPGADDAAHSCSASVNWISLPRPGGVLARILNIDGSRMERPMTARLLGASAGSGFSTSPVPRTTDPSIFKILAKTPPGRGNEIQLTDALQECAASSAPGGGVHGVIFRGRRYDTGDRLDYLKAVVRLAVDHRELGSDFSSWLTGFVAERDSAAQDSPTS